MNTCLLAVVLLHSLKGPRLSLSRAQSVEYRDTSIDVNCAGSGVLHTNLP